MPPIMDSKIESSKIIKRSISFSGWEEAAARLRPRTCALGAKSMTFTDGPAASRSCAQVRLSSVSNARRAAERCQAQLSSKSIRLFLRPDDYLE